MTRSATRLLLVLAASLVALFAYACFSLSFQDGSIACSDDPSRLCPTGYSCVDMFCWHNQPSSSDGGSD